MHLSLQLPLNRSAPDKVDLHFEQEVSHQSLASLRFIPPANLLGSHEDPNPETRNTANSCYCLKDQSCKRMFAKISQSRRRPSPG